MAKMVNITLCIHYDNTKTKKKNPELSQLFVLLPAEPTAPPLPLVPE